MVANSKIKALAVSLAFAAPLAQAGGIPNILPTPPVYCDRQAPAMRQFMFDAQYSDKLSFVFDPKYINNIGTFDALSLEFAFGSQEFRGASTWGHALTDNLFFKISAEYLAQEPTFFFVSGQDSQWVGQGAVGADIKWWTPWRIGVNSVHASFLYAKARNEMLDKVIMNGAGLTNYRQVNGAQDWGGGVGVTVVPWASGELRLDLLVDSVFYENTFEAKKDSQGFGGAIGFTQWLNPEWSLSGNIVDRQPYYIYDGKISWIACSRRGSHLEVNGTFRYLSGDIPEPKESRWGLGISYSWDGDPYGEPYRYKSPLKKSLSQRVVDYANKPAVRMPEVLVSRDQLLSP